MSAEHDHSLIATLVDYLWAVILLVVGGIGRFVYGHEQRVTRLEAQQEECLRSRQQQAAAMHESRDELKEMRDEVKVVSGKVDRVLGALGVRHHNDGGQ